MPRWWEWEVPGFQGHLRVTELTAGTRVLESLPPVPTSCCPESHRVFWNLSEGMPF